jgi:RHS repeat-associated protein
MFSGGRRVHRLSAVWSGAWLPWSQRLAVVTAMTLVATLAQAPGSLPNKAQATPAAPAVPAATPGPLERADASAALVTARMTGKRVKITGLTSETSESWALPDGGIEATVSAGVVRVRSGNGWVPVDLTLRATADGSVTPVAHPLDLRLSGAQPAGEHELAAVGIGDRRVSMRWNGVLPQPVLNDNQATYPDVLPGVDLVVQATRTGFENHLVVKTQVAAAQVGRITFPLTGPGVASYTRDSTGGVALKNAAGAVIARSPAPEMWDAQVSATTGRPARRVVMATSIVNRAARAGQPGGVDWTVAPDAKWLNDPATVYPVVLDPQVNPVTTTFDTYVTQNDTVDRSGATLLQVGLASGVPSRSFLNWSTSVFAGKQITAATVYLWNSTSPTCTAKSWEIWTTGAASAATRWTSQPAWNYQEATSTATKGFTGCAAGWSTMAGTSFFQRAATAGASSATMGVRATTETDTAAFKQFSSRDTTTTAQVPYAVVTYNSYPTVGNRSTEPSVSCVTGSGRPYVNTTSPTLRSQILDADGGTVRPEFKWTTVSGTAVGGATPTPAEATGTTFTATIPSGQLTENSSYSWQVRGFDGIAWGSWSSACEFTVDTTVPSVAPGVSSTSYPAGSWAGGAGTAGSFTFTAGGVADIEAYVYDLDIAAPTTVVNAASLGGSATVSITPAADGPHTLTVRSRDRGGNLSSATTYAFNIGAGAVTSPGTGDLTAGTLSLQGVGRPDATGITYQWRRADTDAWTTIPTADVTYTTGGGAVSAWPVATSGAGAFPKLTWRLDSTVNNAEAGPDALDGPVQVHAVISGPTGGSSSAVKMSLDRNQAAAANSDVGLGSVNLLTGNLAVGQTDTTTDGISVSRTFNTRRPGGVDALFGPGWTSSLSAPNAPYTKLNVTGSLVQLGLPSGDVLGFTATATTGSGVTYAAPTGSESLTLVYTSATNAYTLTDTGGDIVTFTRASTDPAGQYMPTSSASSGSGTTVAYSWQKATVDGQDVLRPTQVLAPIPAGVTCTTLVRGCRALTFSYATTTTATGTDTAGWGDYTGRVTQVAFTAWDPDLATPAMHAVVLARYSYDTTGRLRAAWDPRLDYTDTGGLHHLWNTYTYDTNGILTTLTPAGQQPWQFTYTTIPGDSGTGRLAALTRSALSAGTATTTVVYQVPTTGSGAPYDLSGTQTARWDQSDPPVNATAIFPPSQVPTGNQAAGTLPSSYERATISYLDDNASEVNTAQPGGYLTATWFDQYGNTVRTLTAANRQRAVTDSSSDSTATEAALAQDLSTIEVYSTDGQRLTDIYGPRHDVVLTDWTTVRGRAHTAYRYDEGAPSGGPYNLPTTQTTTVRYTAANGTEADADARTTASMYDWTLRRPTSTTLDPNGLALTTRIAYDGTGRVRSVTAPAGGTSTTTPSSHITVYYGAGTGSGYTECDSHPEWANLPCRVQPGGQPGSGPELPVTVTTYDMFDQPRVVTEKTSSGTLRTTTTTYDAADRAYETSISTAAGLGTGVPLQRNVYDAASGLLTTTQSVISGNVTAQAVRGYDSLGRQISYTDADGNVATTTYDLLSRIATTNDGKATRTYTYDSGTERRGLLTQVVDSQAGTFTGSYDADGTLTSQWWAANSIAVDTYPDETGAVTGIDYTQPGCGQSDCTLYSEYVGDNVHGQHRWDAGTWSTFAYEYDADSRLTAANDHTASGCVVRAYAYDSASNRWGSSGYYPHADGSCGGDAATPDFARSWTYDSADRVTNTGYTYDTLGRTTILPAADTANPSGGNVTITYHTNDLVDTITQGTRATAYTLDVTQKRIRSWTDNATGTTVTSVNHYSNDSDSPAWTQDTSTSYSRPIASFGGMAGIYHSAGATIDWQITSLHGDLVANIHGNATGITATHEDTEYGTPRNSADIGTLRYGWLGAEQRAADTPSGIVLMGVRLYNTATGRFLSVDPIYGGNANAYDYCTASPTGCVDLTGMRGNRQGITCSTSAFHRTCTFYFNEHWTQEVIGDLNWLAAAGAACAGISALFIWLYGFGAAGVAICGAISGVAWLAAATMERIDSWGGHVGVYVRAYWVRFGWYSGRWHFAGGYIWHQ